jgi:hypothetical protein
MNLAVLTFKNSIKKHEHKPNDIRRMNGGWTEDAKQ